jgi:hypothetical protein
VTNSLINHEETDDEMKKNTAFLLLGTLALVVSVSALHGCGTKEATAPGGMTANPDSSTPPAATPAKFTIVGSGS